MGLSLSVGMLADLLVNDEEGAEWFADEIDNLNGLLAKAGLKTHIEPRTLPDGADFSCDMWGYRGLHRLRRIAVHMTPQKGLLGARAGKLPPPSDKDPTEDPLLKKLYDSQLLAVPKFTHLLQHSDAEGFYVPQDFVKVLVSDGIAGGFVGSVQRLQAECRELAAALAIPDGLDPDSDEVMAAMESPVHGAAGWRAYGVETYCCLQMLHACDASLKTGPLLVFC
jgi:hypothetical protein